MKTLRWKSYDCVTLNKLRVARKAASASVAGLRMRRTHGVSRQNPDQNFQYPDYSGKKDLQGYAKQSVVDMSTSLSSIVKISTLMYNAKSPAYEIK
jgi:hypothetical protein